MLGYFPPRLRIHDTVLGQLLEILQRAGTTGVRFGADRTGMATGTAGWPYDDPGDLEGWNNFTYRRQCLVRSLCRFRFRWF